MGFHHHPCSSSLAPHSQITAKAELKTSRVSRLEGVGCAPALPTAPGQCWDAGGEEHDRESKHSSSWGFTAQDGPSITQSVEQENQNQKCFTDRPKAFPVMSIRVWQEGCESCSRYLRQPQNTECAAQVTTMKSKFSDQFSLSEILNSCHDNSGMLQEAQLPSGKDPPNL